VKPSEGVGNKDNKIRGRLLDLILFSSVWFPELKVVAKFRE
jgi:hypothetical protein